MRAQSLLESFDIDKPYVAETRRTLQTLIRRTQPGERGVYIVTSAARGEGKSTICALLGIVAARLFNRRTLLIDGDLHRPNLHNLLGLSPTPGLCDVLSGRAALDLVTRSTVIPSLFAIPCGRTRDPLGDSYRDEEFRKLIATVRESYDLVFVDSAPVVPVVESLLMAEHMDGILVLAMAGRTPVTQIRRMRQILEPVASKVRGVILNNALEGLPYYYDYRYYGYEPESRRRIRRQTRGSGRHSTPTEPGRPAP